MQTNATPVEFGSKYELLCKLASGGMAEIFLARSRGIEGFEKYLVIKKILQNRTEDPDFVRMFLDEARVAATLDHPNVVHIYDVGSVDNEYFIAMEHLQGHDLSAVLRTEAKSGRRPPIEHTISIMSHVCAGLHYAHEKRDFQGRPLEIVHRDVTPQNILITFEGVVKLVDFGIAKAASREVETMAGTLKGKVGYMSPEQCRGAPVDRRSDLFAMGVLLYEMSTGRRLYRERSDFDAIKRIIEGPVPTPKDVMPTFPAELERIIVRCLQKDPEHRYQTARELQSDLERFARDNQLVTGTVPLEQYMEQLFADEISAMRTNPTNAAATMATAPSSRASYVGEAARSQSNPLMDATRQRQRTRLLQLVTVAASAVVVALVWKHWSPPSGTTASAPTAATTSAATMPAAARPATPATSAAPASSATPPAPSLAPTTPPLAAATPAPATPRPRASAPRAGEAHVTIASEPRCEVLIDGTPHGNTPIVDAAVPAGRHTLTLLNSAANIREVEHIALASGQLWSRAFSFSDGHVQARAEIPARMLAKAEPAPRAVEHVPAAPEPRKESPVVRPRAVDGPVTATAGTHAGTAPPHATLTAKSEAVTPPPPRVEPAPTSGERAEAATSAPAPAPASLPEKVEPARWRTEAFDRSPPYPDAAMKSGVEGQVVLRVCIDTSGSVETAQVLKPLGFGCDEAAASWAKRRWRFDPARRGGKPVPTCIIQPVNFKRGE